VLLFHPNCASVDQFGGLCIEFNVKFTITKTSSLGSAHYFEAFFWINEKLNDLQQFPLAIYIVVAHQIMN
jgi:hypothetical protein